MWFSQFFWSEYFLSQYQSSHSIEKRKPVFPVYLNLCLLLEAVGTFFESTPLEYAVKCSIR